MRHCGSSRRHRLGICRRASRVSAKGPVVHLEAGLRTTDLYQPYPEEGLRRAITRFASLHLAPTDHAKENLLREGIPADTIVVTGNTSIDAIKEQLQNLQTEEITSNSASGNYCVLTVHRRESWGEGLDAIAQAVFQLATEFPHVDFICPLHPNPIVRGSFTRLPKRSNFKVSNH